MWGLSISSAFNGVETRVVEHVVMVTELQEMFNAYMPFTQTASGTRIIREVLGSSERGEKIQWWPTHSLERWDISQDYTDHNADVMRETQSEYFKKSP